MDLDWLRQETRGEHASAESGMDLMSRDLTVEAYVDALKKVYGVVHAWESWAVAHVPEDLRGLLLERLREAALLHDLRHFGVDGSTLASPQIQISSSRPGFLGAMYVMEGSRLGGQYIASHVESVLHLNAEQGSSFFRGYGEQTKPMWQEFRKVLAAVDDADATEVLTAARLMFGAFEAWMKQPQ